MTPLAAIAVLDRQIRQHGQTVLYSRDGGSAVPMRAFVRGYSAKEIAGGIEQGDSAVTISPTEWAKIGADVEPEKLDRVEISGRECVVEVPETVRLADRIVRFNLQVRG